jgi:hypothetical protein
MQVILDSLGRGIGAGMPDQEFGDAMQGASRRSENYFEQVLKDFRFTATSQTI